MPPKKNQPLRQTTLLGQRTLIGARASTSKIISPAKRKRNVIVSTHDTDDDDENNGLGAIKFEPKVPSTAGSESEKELPRPVKKRRNVVADDDRSRATRPSTQKTRVRKKASTSDSEEEMPKQRRRKLVKGKRRAAVESTSSESDDLAEEVEKEHILSSRLRSRDKKTPFQKSLERLKRRKQGKPSESSSSAEEEEDESEEDDAPFKGAKPTSDRDSLFDEDSDASHPSDFIVEDDGAAVAPLPLQFSMESHQDLDHQFKKIFQFFVHIAVRPAKERREFMKEQLQKEEYFSVPLQVARRKISGLRDSLVASSTWRPEFKKPLETYPEFDLLDLSFAVPSCDACHLGGRVSTLIGRLSGLPYNRLGFEINDKKLTRSASGSDTDDSKSDSDDESVKSSPTVVEFHLGRFCAKRTRVYHAFTHWEYSLFKCIRDEVDELHESKQSGGFFRIAYAGGKKPPKDLDDADGICDWLDERKVIDMEWVKIKDMMESARHLELASKRGDDD